MKILRVVPEGWPCTLEECPPGHFTHKDQLCFKTEYRDAGKIEAYNSAGEFFCGDSNKTIVQPVIHVWAEEEL
jgi:hypothetical protein